MTLRRPAQTMPPFVEAALDERGLRRRYDERPPYQRNDYLGWINRAKRMDTKLRRMERMLEELEAGEGYMGMAWTPRDPEGR